ncbi:MAG TPA: response regulator [Allosphingosinicella sp.]|jgi:CheY-like chemotaxis protein
MSGAGSGVQGLNILLVEDEPIIAMTAEDMLDALGCRVVASASTLAEALAATARGGFDLAMLDINLNGVASLDVADALKAAGTPFIFTTGYGAEGSGNHGDVPLVTKPYRLNDLEEALTAAVSHR